MKLLGQHCKNNANLLNNIVQKHTRNVNLPHIVQKNNFRFFGSAQVVPIQRRFGDHLSMALCNTFNKLHGYEDEQLLVCADLKPNAYKYMSFTYRDIEFLVNQVIKPSYLSKPQERTLPMCWKCIAFCRWKQRRVHTVSCFYEENCTTSKTVISLAHSRWNQLHETTRILGCKSQTCSVDLEVSWLAELDSNCSPSIAI